MRMSCNGCRVLRKGCGEECNIRPCLQWMRSSEAQSNATLFLAKFYGRAGLINLINSGPKEVRPAIFRSLLYEACGRIVNPVNGSVGLMCSGDWHLCESAVEAVLNGLPVATIPNFRVHDVRHVSKNLAGPLAELHKVTVNRARFKRSAPQQAGSAGPAANSAAGMGDTVGASNVTQAGRNKTEDAAGDDKSGLDLSLGLAQPGGSVS